MTLQASGNAIKFSEIQTEFGGSNPISLSEYYAGGASGYVVPQPTPGYGAIGYPGGTSTPIPTSGTNVGGRW